MIPGICDFRLTLELLAANGCELQHRQYRSRPQLLDRAVDFGVTLAVLMGQTDRRGTEARRRVQKMLELQHPLPLWTRRASPRTNPKSSASAILPLWPEDRRPNSRRVKTTEMLAVERGVFYVWQISRGSQRCATIGSGMAKPVRTGIPSTASPRLDV